MKIKLFVFSCVLIMLWGELEIVYCQCVDKSSNQDAVAVPVVLEFRNEESRVRWIYESLMPRLQLASGKELLSHTVGIRDGRLEAIFCVAASDIPPQNSKFYFLFGARKLEASVRPIHGGTMPTIVFLNQPDPNWIIIRQATWSLNNEGFPRLEVELFNFSNSPHPGVNLAFQFSTPKLAQCIILSPSFYTVPVSIRVERGKVSLKSGDPQSSELINRLASVSINKCALSSFSGELGPTGVIQGKAPLRIRYSFLQKASLGNIQWKIIFEEKLTAGDLLSLPDREIKASGELAFPSSIKVKD